MVSIVLGQQKMPCEHLLRRFCDHTHYDTLVSDDTDYYRPGRQSEDTIVFKFRKQAFTPGEQRLAYEGLRAAAVTTHKRGVAAGPRTGRLNSRDWVTAYQAEVLCHLSRQDPNVTLEEITRKHQGGGFADEPLGQVWLRSKVLAEFEVYEGWFERWLTRVRNQSSDLQKQAADHVLRTFVSNTTYAQPAPSGTAGYLDRNVRSPFGRPTRFTERYPAQFAKCLPWIRKLELTFRRELPKRWRQQRDAADKVDRKFIIAGSVFSTLTVNHNWRTAAHRDAGNLLGGLAGITAFTGPDGVGWKGCEFILPEYRIAIQIEPGDLLLVDSQNSIHGNGPFIGDNNDRLSVVAYFREGMLDLKSWRFEELRRQFVKKHGKWAGMWSSPDWSEFLAAHGAFDEDALLE